MKTFLILLTIVGLIDNTYAADMDMYQDADPTKTVVVIYCDGITKYLTVDTKEIGTVAFDNKVLRMFGR